MSVLFDREAELEQLRALLADARSGAGRLSVISGPPGIGKTALLDHFLAEASAAGCRVMRARCGEFEQDFAHAVARQLVEPVLSTMDSDERERGLTGPAARAATALDEAAAGESVAASELFHALYWLCANLAAERAVVMAVDDAQWADQASMQWLLYLARRIEQVAILIVLTADA